MRMARKTKKAHVSNADFVKDMDNDPNMGANPKYRSRFASAKIPKSRVVTRKKK